MPLVEISLWQGRAHEDKAKLIEGVTKVLCDVMRITPDRVTVIIREVPKENWGDSGRPSG